MPDIAFEESARLHRKGFVQDIAFDMRRLGKEVYLINYNNDVHNPASRANQKDIAMRMQQFFDNKLKGMPAPDWMVHGIPAKDKGKDQVTPPPGIIRP